MRPDLIRLLVDTRRKELITHADQDGGVGTYNTMDRVGLSMPLDVPTKVEGLNGVSKKQIPVQTQGPPKKEGLSNGFGALKGMTST